jgi:hypothetical protein
MSTRMNLNEFTKEEWRDVAREVRPDLGDDEFDRMWRGFQEVKARKTLH